MGVNFCTRTPEEYYDRLLFGMGHQSGRCFFQIASLLETKLGLPCGISDESYQDNYAVNPEEFVPFFERFMSMPWKGEHVEHLFNWAEFASGMFTNITGEPRIWRIPNGPVLYPLHMYSGDKQLDEELAEKRKVLLATTPPYPAMRHAPFQDLSLAEYEKLINETQV